MLRVIGLVLVGLGIVSLLYSGFSYTKNKRAVDLGPLQVDVKEKKRVEIPPLAGGFMLVAGAVILVAGGRRKLA